MEVLKKIDALWRAYLWAGCDKVSGGKCKINWEQVCKSKMHGGLGILNLEKFATALRLRWLWGAWTDPSKPWVNLGNPWDDKDKDIFVAATKVLIGDEIRASFWESAWVWLVWETDDEESKLDQRSIPTNRDFWDQLILGSR